MWVNRGLLGKRRLLPRDAISGLASASCPVDQLDTQPAIGARASAMFPGEPPPMTVSRIQHSCRQFRAGLLPDDIVGVPIRPVRIGLAGPLLVLAVRGCRSSERGRKLGRRGESRAVSVHAPGQSRGDLL